MPEVFEARPKKSRVILLLLACIAFIAGSAWILFVPGALDDSRRSPEILTAAAWIGLPFFSLGFVIFARTLLSSGPQIRIDQHGLYWKRWSPAPIPLAAIAEARPMTMGAGAFLCLHLHDPARYPPRSLLLRLTAGPNKAMGTGDVAIPSNGLDCDLDALADALDRWRAAVARG